MKHLETFKMVYETRSFSRAATLLFIAQPTVSAQIKALETEFGVTLFVRNGRGALGVTPAATQLYEQVTTMLATWAELHATLDQTPMTSQCHIAASHTFATALLPQLLPRLYRQFTHTRFVVTMQNSQAVAQAVQRHEADLGVIEKPLAVGGLTRTPLQADQLVRVGTTGPWLVREPDSGVAYYTRRYLAEQNEQGPQLLVASNAIIVALLHQGFGQSIVAKRTVVDLPCEDLGPRYRRQFFLLTRTNDAAHATLAQAVTRWATA
ncbi:LysR family transcriptional regulator [Lacticaseibacillus daqingensis]|uniref:LysR family transcriptional regulator n=1 Tax=Lacticaseibacillus daqingensis TaxID=2486014 RepID=UPI000F78F6F1|nr:LysR family transcriptional regulator [Lacticaseibacillus daqingensis]